MIDPVELKALVEKATPTLQVHHGENGGYEIWGCYPSGSGFVVCSRSAWEHRAEMSRANGDLLALAPTLARQVLALSERLKEIREIATWEQRDKEAYIAQGPGILVRDMRRIAALAAIQDEEKKV